MVIDVNAHVTPIIISPLTGPFGLSARGNRFKGSENDIFRSDGHVRCVYRQATGATTVLRQYEHKFQYLRYQKNEDR